MQVLTRSARVFPAVLAAAALGVSGIVALAPAAHAAPTVASTSATWGVKQSLRNYIAESGAADPRNVIAVGECAVFDGNVPSTKQPAINKAGFVWANGGGSGEEYDSATKTGTVKLNGAVTFTYQGHFEAIKLSSPTLQLEGTTGKLLLDVKVDSSFLNQYLNSRQVHFGNLGTLPAPTTTPNGDGTTTDTYTNVPVSLTATGANAMGNFYAAGEALDAITFSVRHGGTDTWTSTTTGLQVTPESSSLTTQPVTYAATVTPSGAGGCVEFYDGATKVGAAPVESGAASQAVSGFAAGEHTLSATFRPSSGYVASTSAEIAHTVTAPASSTALTVSPTTVAYGKARTAKVTVTSTAPVSGSVTLKEGTRSFGTKTLASGTATFTLPTNLSVAKHTLTATYSGPLQTSSKSATLTVTKASTKSKGTLVKKTVKVGKKGSIKASVTASGFTPTGKVQVKEGKKVLKTATLSKGKKTITLPKLKKGKHKLVVRYVGSSVANASTSAKVTLTVKKK